MEELLRLLAEQNQFLDPEDKLSHLVHQSLSFMNDELCEEDLCGIQAARGVPHSTDGNWRDD